MAPIVDLANLSSNWKILQRRLPPPKAPEEKAEAKPELKRKRNSKVDEEHAKARRANIKGTGTKTHGDIIRKRQKMEEPASIGASAKHNDPKSLSRSMSMTSLTPKVHREDDDGEAINVLAPSPDHPDIENEGVSSTALPGKYIAIDCEMVGTGPEPDRDSALARVSAVNYHGHQVYDSYVQVKVKVTDYRTKVSGIEPRHINKNVARTFKEVHEDLKTLLEGRILVGHAVKNDLDALLLKHDRRYIRDTSKYSKFRELAAIPGRTPALKTLVKELLGVEIQTGAHSSVEDARATMAVFRLKKFEFEQELLEKYGHVKMALTGMEVGEVGSQEAASKTAALKTKSKNKKKKRKH